MNFLCINACIWLVQTRDSRKMLAIIELNFQIIRAYTYIITWWILRPPKLNFEPLKYLDPIFGTESSLIWIRKLSRSSGLKMLDWGEGNKNMASRNGVLISDRQWIKVIESILSNPFPQPFQREYRIKKVRNTLKLTICTRKRGRERERKLKHSLSSICVFIHSPNYIWTLPQIDIVLGVGRWRIRIGIH